MDSDHERVAADDDARGSASRLSKPPMMAGVAVATLLAGGWIAWGSGTKARPAAKVGGATTSSTIPEPTAAPESDALPTVAPLTGLAAEPGDAVRLLRPALIAKIDGAVEAMPQAGLERAD
ncbi:MAG: hypothetical protein ACR2OH_08720, partial [Microthrixaceae bacterium]